MANTIITAAQIARAALATLYHNTIFLPLVNRDYEETFQPGVGNTVNVRKPATFTALAYNGSTVTVQNATETSVPVVMDQHFDVSFAVTSIDMTQKVTDFAAQFLNPALEAHAQGIDKALIAKFENSGWATLGGPGDGGESWENPKVLIDAKTALSENGVPLTNRSVIASSRMAGEWLKDPLFNRVDQSGETAGLREASMGSRKFGFDPYESNNITTNQGYAFHRDAVTFASRPLWLPKGAADAAVVSYKGIGIRVVYDYNMNLKSDVVSLDVLYGIKVMDTLRGVIIDGSASS